MPSTGVFFICTDCNIFDLLSSHMTDFFTSFCGHNFENYCLLGVQKKFKGQLRSDELGVFDIQPFSKILNVLIGRNEKRFPKQKKESFWYCKMLRLLFVVNVPVIMYSRFSHDHSQVSTAWSKSTGNMSPSYALCLAVTRTAWGFLPLAVRRDTAVHTSLTFARSCK